MNEKTQYIIKALQEFTPNGVSLDQRNHVAARFGESLVERISPQYQLCFVVANISPHTGDLRHVESWFKSELGKYFSEIQMRAFPFDDLKTLKESLHELSKHYNVYIDEQNILRDILDKNPVYILTFVIPKIFVE